MTWEPSDAEIEAAAIPQCAEHQEVELICGDCLVEQLRAVGPLIAARALREAHDLLCVFGTPVRGDDGNWWHPAHRRILCDASRILERADSLSPDPKEGAA